MKLEAHLIEPKLAETLVGIQNKHWGHYDLFYVFIYKVFAQ